MSTLLAKVSMTLLLIGWTLTEVRAQNEMDKDRFQTIQYSNLLDQSLNSILAKIDTVPPKITGGFMSITSSGLAASMLLMAINITNSKRAGQGKAMVDTIPTLIRLLRDSLFTLAEEDNELFRKLLQSYRMPRSTSTEKHSRDSTISILTYNATITPIMAAEMMAKISEIAIEFLPRSASNVRSDVIASLYLIDGSMQGVLALVATNLSDLSNKSKRELEFRIQQIQQRRLRSLQIFNKN